MMKLPVGIILNPKEINMELFVKNVVILITTGRKINGVMSANPVDLERV